MAKKLKFKIGDLIVPKEPLKQTVGVVVNIRDGEASETGKTQDLQVMFQDTGKLAWVSSLDVKLLSYKKAQ
tara:strand:+ start:1854 stop:2066 length:213 start_codon:yes stop_codon:yes gene_type:complete